MTLLMQTILPSIAGSFLRSTNCRGAIVNYANAASGDDMPDAGAIDSDDSDLIASSGMCIANRQARGHMHSFLGFAVLDGCEAKLAFSTKGCTLFSMNFSVLPNDSGDNLNLNNDKVNDADNDPGVLGKPSQGAVLPLPG